jgi:hypothetical protein
VRIVIIHHEHDRPYCVSVVKMIDYYTIWFYQKHEQGETRWKEMQSRIAWCDGALFLISEKALASADCLRELEVARAKRKPIIPVLVDRSVHIPDELNLTKYVDLSSGLTVQAVHDLMRALYVAEHAVMPPAPVNAGSSFAPQTAAEQPRVNIEMIVKVLENGEYAYAIELIDELKARGESSKFIKLDQLRELAQSALDRQREQQQMEQEYRNIYHLIKANVTRQIGIEAFQRFHQRYPDYDPDGLTAYINPPINKPISLLERLNQLSAKVPLLEWREVPGGYVRIRTGESGAQNYVESFLMTRYPITNLQYNMFIKASNGYCDPHWWDFAPEAREWRESAPKPKPPKFGGAERPRETVNWYDARAFCNWLGYVFGAPITLPTLRQRQRAIMGDDDRVFPWGSNFDPARCNTAESGLRMTTVVNRYPNGVSQYDIYDLVGNTWEWCLDTVEPPASSAGDKYHVVIHGGSFLSKANRAHVTRSMSVPPLSQYGSIGFRAVALLTP